MWTTYLEPSYPFPLLLDPLNTSHSSLHVYVYTPLSPPLPPAHTWGEAMHGNMGNLPEAVGSQRKMTPLLLAATMGQQLL